MITLSIPVQITIEVKHIYTDERLLSIIKQRL